ncbi:hypothetical protein BZA70DRAFT_268527 [Myxozyma melibiosi]|uniref:Uncharacterized protein n=1 Tax=Myxozyma melibiosi TaxID=54550 RepID=A0ABR1F2P8_9ASCO
MISNNGGNSNSSHSNNNNINDMNNNSNSNNSNMGDMSSSDSHKRVASGPATLPANEHNSQHLQQQQSQPQQQQPQQQQQSQHSQLSSSGVASTGSPISLGLRSNSETKTPIVSRQTDALALAPPSSGQQKQLPSSFLPNSSPAQFWNFMHLLSTPVKQEYSPSKYDNSPVANEQVSPYRIRRPGAGSGAGNNEEEDDGKAYPSPQRTNGSGNILFDAVNAVAGGASGSGTASLSGAAASQGAHEAEGLGDLQGVDLAR